MTTYQRSQDRHVSLVSMWRRSAGIAVVCARHLLMRGPDQTSGVFAWPCESCQLPSAALALA